MAARTVTRLPRYGTVVEYDLQPIGGVMAYVTGLSRRYVIRILTGGNSAVMAIPALIRGLAMIKRHHKALPSWAGGVAGFAQVAGDRMGCGFTGSIGAVMTCSTTVSGLIMRKRHDEWSPCIRGVAKFAVVGCYWVCRGFIGGIVSRVAHGTVVGGLIMGKR